MRRLISARPGMTWLVSRARAWVGGLVSGLLVLAAAQASAAEMAAADMPADDTLVIGRISDHERINPPAWKIVRESQVEVANADPHGAWVDCDDLNDLEVKSGMINGLHYTKLGYELLGRRYVRQAKALIEGRKPAENGRPE